jgi:hypothetical protein
MGKTLNKIVYSILEAVSNFEITDDSPFSPLWVEDQVITQNHTLIRKAQTERRIDEMLYMTDEKLPVHVFDKVSSIAGIPVSNCNRFSYVDINTPLTGLKGAEIDLVSNTGYSIIFKRTSIRELIRDSSGYYSLNRPSYAILDNTLVFKTSGLAGLKFISMSAIFNDPRLVSSWNEDDIFKTPSEKNLELLTIQHIGTALGMPMDLVNDAQRAYSQPKPSSDE